MGIAIESTLESRNPLTSSTMTVVENIFDSIREAVNTRLVKYQEKRELYGYLKQKVSNYNFELNVEVSLVISV